MNWAWLLVLGLYVVAVAIARWAGVDLPRRVALLFLLLVFGFLWTPLTQPVVIVPADVLKLMPPWSEVRAPGRGPVTKYEVSNLNLHDVPMQIVPWMHQVRKSWREGKVPLWNAAAGTGYPLLANGQSTPFSPFVLATLTLPLGYAITAQAALKLLLALVLTYLFCRRRYSPLASVAAAIAYGFSTWMVTWLQFPIATAAAFLPGVLLAVEVLIENSSQQQAEARVGNGSAPVEKEAPPRLPFAVSIFALTVLSGHPETVFNIGLIAAAQGLWIVFVERRGSVRGLARVAGASLLAACISAPFLVPFAEAVRHSQRLAELRVGPDSSIPPYSDRASAILLLQPRFFGHLPIERPWGPTSLESVCGFAGVLSLASLVAAALFTARLRRWKERETLYVIGAVSCVGIVLGWPLLRDVFDAIAGLAPAMRMRLGICWFASVLIAPVVDWTRRISAVPLLTGAAVVAGVMLWLLRATTFPTSSHLASAVLSLLPSVGVLLAISLVAFRRTAALAAAVALTVFELWVAMAHWNPIRPASELHPETPLIAELQRLHAAAGEPVRIVGLGGQLYPNAGVFWGFEDVRVHDPMAWDRYVALLADRVGWNAADYYAKWPDATTPLLDSLNVGYVVSDHALEGGRHRLVYEGRDGWIYENVSVLPRFYSETATVTILAAGGDSYRLRVEANSHSIIASSVAAVPGWTAGDIPLFEKNGPFLAFMVPPGTHEVEVRYQAGGFVIAAALSLITIAGLATTSVLARRRRRRRPR